MRVSLETDIMRKGTPSNAGSKALKGFIAPFNATVVTRLENAGINISDEAAISNEFGISRLAAEEDYTPEAVKIIKNDLADACLCNDFSGTIRRHAPKKAICYIHPTYGTVSRFGLIPSVSSMDVIGVACKDVSAGFEILSVIAGKDEKDGAMYVEKSYAYEPKAGKIKIGVPENVKNDYAVSEFVKQFETVSFEMKYFSVFEQVSQILAFAEICNNMSRYDGVKFGYRAESYRGLNELYISSRTEGFGLSAKLSAIVGSIVLSEGNYVKYYEKAMKIRRLIKETLDFNAYDIIAMPCGGGSELAGLAGLPSVSFPYSGGGVEIFSAPKNENVLYGAWEAVNR